MTPLDMILAYAQHTGFDFQGGDVSTLSVCDHCLAQSADPPEHMEKTLAEIHGVATFIKAAQPGA